MNIATRATQKLRALKNHQSTQRAAKRTLRGPTQLELAVGSRIGLMNSALWDAATSGHSVFLQRGYLAMLEGALPKNLSPRYALVVARADDGSLSPVAAVHLQIASLTPTQLRPLPDEEPGKLRKAWAQWLDGTAAQRVLTCGNFLTYGQHGVAVAPGADSALAWHAVAEVIYRLRHAEKITGSAQFAIIKDLHGDAVAPARALEQLSYRWVETEPNMVLTLDPAWRSHADYLASLASKYRSTVKNSILKPIEEAGCTTELLSDVAPHAHRLHALYKSVQANADFRPFELPGHYFPTLAAWGAQSNNRCRVTVLRQGDAILGFLVSLRDGDTAVAYHIGFDREAAATLPIYLRLLHVGVADGIALGAKRISFGRTALEPKAALGAQPEPFGVLVRHRQPLLNKLIKPLLTGIEHDEAPVRSPFKKVAA